MNNHINNFKNRMIIVLALLPSLVFAQEIETQTLDFGHTYLEIHGQPGASEKSTNDKMNTIFYQAGITIHKGETQTNIHAEKAEMIMVDNKGRSQTIILHDATIENNVMSAFANEAIILSDSGTIRFLTDKVDMRGNGIESDILNNSESLINSKSKTTSYTCQDGKVFKNGQDTGFSSVEMCSNGVTTTMSCSGGNMTITQTVATFCGGV